MDNEDIKKNISTDVAIATLTADFKNLRKDFNEFHLEVKESFRDLKDNYSTRINRLEECKLDRADFHETKLDFEGRMRKNENDIARILTWGTAFMVLLGVIEFLIQKFF